MTPILYFLVFVIPFSVPAPFLNSILISDIALAAFIIFSCVVFLNGGSNRFKISEFTFSKLKLPLILFLFFSALSVFLSSEKASAFISFLRILLTVAVAMIAVKIFQQKRFFERILFLFAALAVFEAAVGIFQFGAQGSIGLSKLGEPHLTLADSTIARAIVGEGRVIRAYGTFPHPNVLAAFLVIGLAIICYFWFRLAERKFEWNPRESRRLLFKRYFPILLRSIFLSAALFVLLAGLVLTFSRAAWAIAFLLFLYFIFYFLFSPLYRRQALKLFVVLVASGYWLAASLYPFISPRFHISFSEPSVTERIAYNKIGLEIIRAHPFGVGVGNQVNFAITHGLYQKYGLTRPILLQPIHNTYLLMASEIGILGLVAFLLLIGSLFWKLQYWKSFDRLSLVISYLLLVILLLFALTDHFPWTLPQGQLMLWFIIGMVIATISSRRSMDRTPPSEGGDAGSIPAGST